jgi:UDP-glucuronate 4-epimerase
MTVLVTGAAGFIGSHLTERLLEHGHSVVGLDNFDTFYDPAIKERNLERARDCARFTEVRGDIRDPEAYARLPDGVEAVVHLAARAGVRPSIADPALYMDVNLTGTMHLLEFMRARSVPRLLFGSSSSIYGDADTVPFEESHPGDRPISPYASTKRSGELMVHAHAHLFDIDAVCLRFFTVYGPRQRPDLAIHKFASLMSRGEEIPMYGDGSSERDYTYIDDILDGILGALAYLRSHPGTYDIVNLGGARTISLQRMIDELARALDVTPQVRRMSMQPGDVRRTYADCSRAERLFGYRPSTPFESGIERFTEWFLTTREPAARSLAAV